MRLENPYYGRIKASEGKKITISPVRRESRYLSINAEDSDAYERAVDRATAERAALRKLAQEWEDGYVSNRK